VSKLRNGAGGFVDWQVATADRFQDCRRSFGFLQISGFLSPADEIRAGNRIDLMGEFRAHD